MDRRGYEPELQKMAAFLRERCDRGQYGLTYADQQKSLIRIPWPTVPRQNEDISESFGMFTEWAYLSFRKRGNRGDQLENEPLSAQKHRFRNALARADGLRQRKELSTETVRVYEFVDTKKDRDTTENGHSRQDRRSPPQVYSHDVTDNYSAQGWLPHPMHHEDLSDSNTMLTDWDSRCSPSTVTSSPNQTPVYLPYMPHTEPVQQIEMQSDDRQPSLGTLIEEMLQVPEPSVDPVEQQPFAQTTGGFTYAVPQPVRNGITTMSQQVATINYSVSTTPQVHSYPTVQVNPEPQSCQQEHHMVVKAQYMGEEVMNIPVFNTKGFRLHSGNNVPDMRKLLDDATREQLRMQTKYPYEDLYGPDFIDQVKLPLPRGPAHHQFMRTTQVIQNMDRGVIFLLDYPPPTGYITSPIPDVYAIRLCQTRVFPFETNVPDSEKLEEDGLKRMQWVKIFDGAEFYRKVRSWVDYSGTPPPSTITLSVGQKPKRENAESNLVIVKISISKAKRMVDQCVEEQMVDLHICISDKSSMDNAAQQHQNDIQSRIRLGDGPNF